MRPLLFAMLASLVSCSHAGGSTSPPPPPPHGLGFATYHFDLARSGWNDAEATLTPARVRGGLTRAWSTPLDPATVSYVDSEGRQTSTFAPRVFATPLYLDDLALATGPLAHATTSVIFTATTNDWLYAIAAVDTVAPAGQVVRAGTILWRASLGTPAYVRTLDGGTPLGVLSTPYLDRTTSPPTLYVTAVDATAGWRAFAIDASSGAVLPGWPVVIDPATVSALDRNAPEQGAPPAMAAATIASQRAALALSAGTLYVGFGSYYDGAIGWMVAIDAASRRVTSSFSGAPVVPVPPPDDPKNAASGGMWGAGGPAIASDGRIFMTTGNSPAASNASRGVWGNSVLAWSPGLELSDTYSPFNYCVMDAGDTDLGGSSAVVFDLDPSRTTTPHLAAFGGKQGVLYLVDRDHLGGSRVARPPCSPDAAKNDPTTDTSLHAGRGPVSVFGPYSDAPEANALDHAKMRTTPALFRPASGDVFVYASGTAKDPRNLATSVPPCLARLRVHVATGERAFLEPSFVGNTTAVLANPGSPIVTSHHGGADPVVWVLDQNARRTDPTEPKPGFTPENARLYAFDGNSLETLWQSAASDLGPSGKYAHVIVAHGTVFVATDGIAAFTAR